VPALTGLAFVEAGAPVASPDPGGGTEVWIDAFDASGDVTARLEVGVLGAATAPIAVPLVRSGTRFRGLLPALGPGAVARLRLRLTDPAGHELDYHLDGAYRTAGGGH
jgi:hypothetical protein